MTTSIMWNITDIDCLAVAPGTNNPNCVCDVHWECIATSTDINPVTNRPYTARSYGTARIAYDPAGTYTPFANLTEAQVLDWAKDVINQDEMVNVAGIEGGITAMMQRQISPTVVKPALPW